jgi:Cu/Ag efflux pump CusA
VIPIAAAMMVVGFLRLRSAPVDVLPEFAPPTVQIQTEALGLSAAEVEQLVTVPMEQDLLNGVPWLDSIRSNSVAGLSSIDLVFNPGTEILRARQMVQERMTQAVALPHVSKAPVMLQPVSSTSRVMVVGLSSKDVSLIDMSVLARWRIKPRLMGVPGVANVSIWGQRERQLQVLVDPEQLAKSNVSLTQVVTTTGNALWVSPLTFVEASTPGTGGFIDTPNQRLSIQHVLPIRTAQDLAQVRVEDTQDAPLRLGDVAKVVEDHQPLIGDAVVNDGPGLMLVVEKFPGANTLDVSRGVEAALEGLKPGMTGITLDTTVYRPATFIEKATGHLAVTLLVSFLLLILFFCLLLFDWRTALVSLVVIPLSTVTAALVLQLRAGTFNTIVLAGLVLALGAVADDVIVDVNHIRRRLHERRRSDGAESTAKVVLEASLQTRGPLVYATLVLLVAAAPFLFLPGVVGAFTRPLAMSFMLAVVASTAVALVVTPVLAGLLLARARGERREPLAVRWAQRGVTAAAARSASRPRAVLAVAAVVILAGLALLPGLAGHSLLPTLQDRNLLVNWTGTPGMSGPEMVRITDQASTELRAVPGVRNVGAHVGRAITSDQVVNANSAELWITIDPAANYGATLTKIQKVVDGYPGFTQTVGTYPAERVRGAVTGSAADLVVRVYGQDLDVLRGKAEEVRRLLAATTGVAAPRIDLPPDEPTVEIEVNLAAAQQYGIRPGDVRRETAILLSGLQAGSLFEDQKIFDVVVWGVPAARQSLTSIRELLIDTPSGGHVRLKDVADVRIRSNPTVIQHDKVSRRVEVTASVRGRDAADVATDVRTKLKGLTFPLEYHAEVLATGSAKRAGTSNLAVGLAVGAVILMLLLLQSAFGSWRLAFAFLLALPLALVGGLLAALVGGVGLQLGSLLGLFLVGCVAVRNGVLLVASYRRGDHREERGAPVLVTAATIALVLLPVLLFGSVSGAEMLYPLAVVALGGLVTSTLFSLFVVPALYRLLGDAGERGERGEPGETSEPGEPSELADTSARK